MFGEGEVLNSLVQTGYQTRGGPDRCLVGERRFVLSFFFWTDAAAIGSLVPDILLLNEARAPAPHKRIPGASFFLGDRDQKPRAASDAARSTHGACARAARAPPLPLVLTGHVSSLLPY